MKRIAEADETGDIALLVKLVGDETRDASAERLAANHQLLDRAAAVLLRTEPFRDIRRPMFRLAEVDASIRRCACRHVVELEAGHGNAMPAR